MHLTMFFQNCVETMQHMIRLVHAIVKRCREAIHHCSAGKNISHLTQIHFQDKDEQVFPAKNAYDVLDIKLMKLKTWHCLQFLGGVVEQMQLLVDVRQLGTEKLALKF